MVRGPQRCGAHAAEPLLDELQVPQQLARGELGVDLRDRVQEVGLVDLAHRLGVVERRGPHQRGRGQAREIVEREPDHRLALAEVGAQPDEGLHARRSRTTSITARPPVVQPRFCLAIRTRTRRTRKRSRMVSAVVAASASSRWKLRLSTTSRTVR